MHLIFGGNVVEVGSVILTNGGCNSVQSSEYRLISAGIAHIKYDGFLNGNPFSFHPCLFFFLQSYLFFFVLEGKNPTSLFTDINCYYLIFAQKQLQVFSLSIRDHFTFHPEQIYKNRNTTNLYHFLVYFLLCFIFLSFTVTLLVV